jgi:hypothetical protein
MLMASDGFCEDLDVTSMAKNLRLPTKYESYQQDIIKSRSLKKIFRNGPRIAFARVSRC